MMDQDRFWELISLKMAGEATAAELTELEQLVREHPEEGARVEALELIWKAKEEAVQPGRKEAFNKHLQRLSHHLSEPVLQYEQPEVTEEIPETGQKEKSRGIVRKLLGAAAVAAALIWAFFYFNAGPSAVTDPVNARNTVSTKKGSKSKVQLPDGSQVWLNADSRIVYNENFRGSVREVELSGEAYFDVVRDESRPFIIHTPTIDVKVLGTAFNVRSYADEMNTETSLIRGSVEITLLKSADQRKIILKPNDKLIVRNEEAVTRPAQQQQVKAPVMTLDKISYQQTDKNAVETLWVMNKLAFDDEPLAAIARKLERWYDVRVIIADEALKKESYTATFEDKTLKEVMDALRTGGGFDYSINKKEVFISRP